MKTLKRPDQITLLPTHSNQPATISFKEPLLRELNQHCFDVSKSRSSIVNLAVREYLDRLKKEKKTQ